MKQNKPLIIIIILASIISFAYTFPKYLESKNYLSELKITVNNLWKRYDVQLNKFETNLIFIENIEQNGELDSLISLISLYNTAHQKKLKEDSNVFYQAETNNQFNFYKLHGSYTITTNDLQDIINMNQSFYEEAIKLNQFYIEKGNNILENYISLYLNFYELKVENNYDSFTTILENEIIIIEYLNLIMNNLREFYF